MNHTGYRPLESGVVRIWDAKKRYAIKHYDFRAWKDRAGWAQVPCGAVDYRFQGDCVLEGENFWLSLHSSPHDAVFLYAKLDAEGTPSRHNELYRAYDAPTVMEGQYSWNNAPGRVRRYGQGSTANRIVKNQPDEVIVESEADMGEMPLAPCSPVTAYGEHGKVRVVLTTRYRLLGGKRWFEIHPVRQASEQGMHGETRLAIVPDGEREGHDYIVDAMKYPGGGGSAHGIWLPDRSPMLLDLAMDIDTIWLMTWPDPFKARPYCINCRGGWPSGWQHVGEGKCPKIISSPFARFGGGSEKIVIGVLTGGYWNYMRVDESVKAGEPFAGTWRWSLRKPIHGLPWKAGDPWRPLYPGRWRIVGCVDGEYYTREATLAAGADARFAFTWPGRGALDSKKPPPSGTLEYLVTYLYDRTDETPGHVTTPMDIFREAFL